MWHVELIKQSVSGFWKLHDWHRKRTWIEVVLIDAENDPGHTNSDGQRKLNGSNCYLWWAASYHPLSLVDSLSNNRL